jgi:hypothetical protein
MTYVKSTDADTVPRDRRGDLIRLDAEGSVVDQTGWFSDVVGACLSSEACG